MILFLFRNPNIFLKKILGGNVPKEYEERFNNKENIDYEIIRAAKELNLKVYSGKFNLKKIEKNRSN